MDILMGPCVRLSCESNEMDIIPEVLFITCLEISGKFYLIQTLCTANNGIIKTQDSPGLM